MRIRQFRELSEIVASSASDHDVSDHRAINVRLLQERLDALHAAAQSRASIASASGQILPEEQCNATG